MGASIVCSHGIGLPYRCLACEAEMSRAAPLPARIAELERAYEVLGADHRATHDQCVAWQGRAERAEADAAQLRARVADLTAPGGLAGVLRRERVARGNERATAGAVERKLATEVSELRAALARSEARRAVLCKDCGGQGGERVNANTDYGPDEDWQDCAACKGTGAVLVEGEVPRKDDVPTWQLREAIEDAATAARAWPLPLSDRDLAVVAPVCRRSTGPCFCGAHRSEVMSETHASVALDSGEGQTICVDPPNCHLCGKPMPSGDALLDGHGLGECVAVCEACGGSGGGEVNTGPDPCNEPCAACLGMGGVPFEARGLLERVLIAEAEAATPCASCGGAKFLVGCHDGKFRAPPLAVKDAPRERYNLPTKDCPDCHGGEGAR